MDRTKHLLVLGALETFTFVALLSLGDLNRAVPAFLGLYFLAFLLYLAAVRIVLNDSHPAPEQPRLVLTVLAFALLFRATLLFSAPSLSDDVFRYVWDGMLVNHGVNPYQYPPAAPELTGLRDPLYAYINHKGIGTPYGPVTLLITAAVEQISHSTRAMKIAFVLFDGLSIFLLIRLLDHARLARANVLVYAWNPLAVVEIAGSGHNDPAAVSLLLGALYLTLRGRHAAAALGFAAAVAAKYFALLFLPALWKHLGKSKWLLVPIGLGLAYLTFLPHLDRHFASLLTVGSFWHFNDSLFAVFQYLAGTPLAAKIIAATVFAVVAILVHRGTQPLLKAALVSIGAALLLTSVLHPWYLLWLLPLLCFYPQRAWIAFSGLVVLSYHVLIRYAGAGVWEESLWVKYAIYLPFYTLLLLDLRRALFPPVNAQATS